MKPRLTPVRRLSPPSNFIVLCLGLASAAMMTPSAQAASGSWTGLGVDSLWSTSANWSASPPPGTGGQTATFNGAGNAKTTIDLGAGVSVSKILFDTATAAAYTIGTGAAGSQNLTLNTDITMSGTVVNNQLFNSNVLLNNNGTFTNNSTTNSLSFAGGISANTAGAKTLFVAGAGITAISGNISNGAGTVGISNGGNLTLSGTNVITGVVITGGAVTISGGSSDVGAVSFNGPNTTLNVNSGAALVTSGITTTANSTTRRLNVNGTLTASGDVGAPGLANVVAFDGGTLTSGNAGGITISDQDNSIAVSAGGATLDTTIGNITSTAILNGASAGAITVQGGNTFFSGVTNTGLLTVSGTSKWDLNNVASSVGGLSDSGTILNSGAADQTLTTTFNNAVGPFTFSGTIAPATASRIAFTKNGSGTQILTGASTYTGATTVSGGTLQLGSGSTTGSLSASSSITTNGTFAVNRSNAVTQGTDFGTIVAGTGGVTQSGDGTLTLNTANTYSGTTQISTGTLVASASGALGSGTVNNGSKLQVTGGITLNNAITTNGDASASSSAGAIESTGNNVLNGNINFGNVGGLITNVISSSGALTIAGNLSTTLGGGRTFNFGGAGDTTVNGSISDGTSAVPVSKNGAGSLTLAGNNTYSGDTTVRGGILILDGDSSIVDTGKLVIDGGKVSPTGNETVSTLFFGAVQQATGTWGSTSSAATNKNNTYFSGTGIITVTGGYTSWAATNVSGQTADLDTNNDGVDNGVAYFMNNTGRITLPGIVGGAVTWTNGGNIPASAYGTQFVVQTSQNLVTWTNVLVGGLTTNTNSTLTYTLPTGQGKWFARLVVTPN